MKQAGWRAAAWVAVFFLLFTFSGNLSAQAEGADAGQAVTGVWACQSMASEAFTGRPCRTLPWLTVSGDKTYEWGQESGTWEFADNVLSLSGRKGKGHINEDGKLIFEYESGGKTYVQTLYPREQ